MCIYKTQGYTSFIRVPFLNEIKWVPRISIYERAYLTDLFDEQSRKKI